MAVTAAVCIACSSGGANEHEYQERSYLQPVQSLVRNIHPEYFRSSELLLFKPGTTYQNIGEIGSDEILPTPTATIELPTPTPTATVFIPEPTPTPAPTVDGTLEKDGWSQFLEGYREAGGNPAYEQRLVCALKIEGSQWIGYYGQNGYWTRAQFSDGDTWPKVVRYLNSIGVEANPDAPYVVGLGVGWWSQQTYPGGIGGWYHTWNMCS